MARGQVKGKISGRASGETGERGERGRKGVARGEEGGVDEGEEGGICVHAKVRALYNRGGTVSAFHRAERSEAEPND